MLALSVVTLLLSYNVRETRGFLARAFAGVPLVPRNYADAVERRHSSGYVHFTVMNRGFGGIAFDAEMTMEGEKADDARAPKTVNKRISRDQVSGLLTNSSIRLSDEFWRIDQQTMRSMDKILSLYKEENIDASCFHGVNGYGHGDIGREKLDSIVAKLLGAEDAAVRLQFFSGTHAIASALFGILRPGESMLCVSGHPYDTLEEVIGLRDGHQTGSRLGSLMDWGIGYKELDLLEGERARRENGENVSFDLRSIDSAIDKDRNIKLLHVQRSCGYKWRPSIPVHEIGRLCEHIKRNYKNKGHDIIVFVDNCYGELVEELEPCHVGADICAGSLIKNLGGTLAPAGTVETLQF